MNLIVLPWVKHGGGKAATDNTGITQRQQLYFEAVEEEMSNEMYSTNTSTMDEQKTGIATMSDFKRIGTACIMALLSLTGIVGNAVIVAVFSRYITHNPPHLRCAHHLPVSGRCASNAAFTSTWR